MSTSLRDQLLKAGLINKKQADDAERQLERQERQRSRPPKHGDGRAKSAGPPRAGAGPAPASANPPPAAAGPPPAVGPPDAAKAARDKELNRRKQEKAELKAKRAQIKQLIEQHRLPPVENGEPYNFVDGAKIRRLIVTADARARLGSGALAIVRHDGGYDLVPAAIAARVRERDPHAVVPLEVAKEAAAPEPGYEQFSVPDDLMW